MVIGLVMCRLWRGKGGLGTRGIISGLGVGERKVGREEGGIRRRDRRTGRWREGLIGGRCSGLLGRAS